MIKPVKKNFLSNKSLLAEIHKSKSSYCYFESPEFADYHVIVNSLDEITEALIDTTLEAARKPKRVRDEPNDVLRGDLIIRVMTFEHIPDDSGASRARGEGRGKAPTPFPPFKHYRSENGLWREVGRSHWKGDLETGVFSTDHGRITNQLGSMFMMLTERYARRANWRNYSYIDEMRSNAVLGLLQQGLKFNEAKSANPFAFYTTTMSNLFVRTLNNEHRQRDIRDDILQSAGIKPSFHRQFSEDRP